MPISQTDLRYCAVFHTSSFHSWFRRDMGIKLTPSRQRKLKAYSHLTVFNLIIPDCFDHNVDIHGDFPVPWDQGGSVANVKHPLACQKLCRAKDGCNFFVYGMSNHPVVLNRRRCFFKAWKTGAAAHAKIVSGPKLC